MCIDNFLHIAITLFADYEVRVGLLPVATMRTLDLAHTGPARPGIVSLATLLVSKDNITSYPVGYKPKWPVQKILETKERGWDAKTRRGRDRASRGNVERRGHPSPVTCGWQQRRKHEDQPQRPSWMRIDPTYPKISSGEIVPVEFILLVVVPRTTAVFRAYINGIASLFLKVSKSAD
jgi:hypothetical protein